MRKIRESSSMNNVRNNRNATKVRITMMNNER
jgi:hypothetical protein